MFDLGINFVHALWFWWCHIADVVPLWNPFGAFFSLLIMLTCIGFGIKKVMGDD
ncbi:MAG: hypothetical protein OSB58_00815 [Alphaproteobacteria bacterium]|jgi:hypothetical protein|nr:hypothetical protein [Alphaproteobacteria bacterium]